MKGQQRLRYLDIHTKGARCQVPYPLISLEQTLINHHTARELQFVKLSCQNRSTLIPLFFCAISYVPTYLHVAKVDCASHGTTGKVRRLPIAFSTLYHDPHNTLLTGRVVIHGHRIPFDMYPCAQWHQNKVREAFRIFPRLSLHLSTVLIILMLQAPGLQTFITLAIEDGNQPKCHVKGIFTLQI